MPSSGILIEIPINGIFRRNTKIPNEIRSIFFIPEEVHILLGSASIMVQNK
uniref:Uncharacterized protein n=1 Tax=Vitis vinifera TaxID=29760 RepID=F6HLY6_VITVI